MISVIIPCYNHGQFLEEAIQSLNLEAYSNIFEVLIINDGSTDHQTLLVLEKLQKQGFFIHNQLNKGLAAARNIGVQLSTGKYILPLDADNKIIPEVFLNAKSILDANPEIGILYTDAIYFGDTTGDWIVPDFDGHKLLIQNYIDACALIKRNVFDAIGDYDKDMPAMGNEDWEFWIRAYILGHKFFHLKEKGFFYRTLSNSMSVTTTRPNYENNKIYIYNKHTVAIFEKISNIVSENETLKMELLAIKKSNTFMWIKKWKQFRTIFK